MALSPNLRGALFMVISMAAFTVNDAIAKFVSDSMNMAQVMLVRGIFASMLVGVIAWQSGALTQLRHALNSMVMLRVAGDAAGTLTFLLALQHLPLANVSAILQALPLAVAMGAALFLGEGVGWRRWLAISVGFIGVLIVVRPGVEGFSVHSLLVLACVLFCAVRDLATRRIPEAIPSLLVSAVTSTAITILGAALLPTMGGWTPMQPGMVLYLALAAVLVLIGYQFIIMAMRVGDISFIAPFRYTALLWAIALSIVIFGDFPDSAMIMGSAIIVASGLYTLYRERVVGRWRPVTESSGPDMPPDGI